MDILQKPYCFGPVETFLFQKRKVNGLGRTSFLPGCSFDARYLQPCNTGCNYDDGPDCVGCDTSKQWDSTITENCGCSGLSCAYKYKCMLRKPSMAMDNVADTERVTACCTGLFNNETALNKCAPGWCPDTKLCHDAMISHCSSVSGWQDGSNPRDYSTSSCARYVNNSKKELAADFLQKLFLLLSETTGSSQVRRYLLRYSR